MKRFQLMPRTVQLHGETIGGQGEGAGANISYWNDASEWISWDGVHVAQPGTYRVSLEVARVNEFDHPDAPERPNRELR